MMEEIQFSAAIFFGLKVRLSICTIFRQIFMQIESATFNLH